MRTAAEAEAEAVVGALEMAAETARVVLGKATRLQPLAMAVRPQRPATTARPRYRRPRQVTR